MLTETLMITFLLSALIVLVLICLYLLLRRPASPDYSDVEVLKERLQSRQSEIENLRKQLEDQAQQYGGQLEANTSLREQVARQQTQLQEERKQQEEKIRLLQSAREQMTLEFKNLANEILEQKGKAFTDVNRQNIQDILKPLSEKIQNFEKRVEETYNKESSQRFSLEKEIRNLQELNARISVEAVNLTNALKGESKTQGNWGEMILERVLESSGLVKGREYVVQPSLKTEQGQSRQPDVIVHLPEKKDVIIDSKVSLTAYERYSSEQDEERKNIFLKEHIQSIRNHIRMLSEKDYDKLEGIFSLDLVMMFLPVEPAFILAVQEDSQLFTEAFDKRIMIVGPSTLLATLKTIQNIWRYEYQNQNALEIARQAGNLYDKFVGFTDDLELIGKHLDRTQDTYEEARKKLVAGRGNLIARVENIKKLGASTSKEISAGLLNEADEDEPAVEDQSGDDSQ